MKTLWLLLASAGLMGAVAILIWIVEIDSISFSGMILTFLFASGCLAITGYSLGKLTDMKGDFWELNERQKYLHHFKK